MPKLIFKKNPPGYAYTAPNAYDVPDAIAAELIAEGYAAEATPVLPKNFPARKKLIAAGLETIDEIAEAIDTLEGFTAAEIANIRKALEA